MKKSALRCFDIIYLGDASLDVFLQISTSAKIFVRKYPLSQANTIFFL